MSSSKQVRCKETGVIYRSVSHLSVATKIYEAHIEAHLKGKKPYVGGKQYEYV